MDFINLSGNLKVSIFQGEKEAAVSKTGSSSTSSGEH